jgi:hypothetical protein
MSDRLRLIPISFAEASEFVARVHRHHKAPIGHKFSVAAAIEDCVVGVAIVGRPVARGLQDGYTLEVLRVATDGSHNACSFLYGAAWRAARALGYSRLITYILQREPGTSLRAAGWRLVGEVTGRSWACQSRPRVDLYPKQDKLRFEVGQG